MLLVTSNGNTFKPVLTCAKNLDKEGNTMTKKEAKQAFATSIILAIPTNDKAAIREAWNNFVDCLQKSRQITRRQAETWVNPFLSQKDR